jgi:hypothetical protein
VRGHDRESDPNAPLGAREVSLRREGSDADRGVSLRYGSFQVSTRKERVGTAAHVSENELHAGTGQECPVCHRAIAAGEPVRLRVDGTYQHDAC